MPKRTRLAKGVYEDAHGVTAVYYVHGQRYEQRFTPDDSFDRIVRWRRRQIAQLAELQPVDRRGSLARDCVRFLKTRKGRPNYKTEKAYLKAWVRALENPLRWKITAQQLRETIATWRTEGYSEQTLRHRVRLLRQLFQTLDGRRAPSPFDEIALPKAPRPQPVSVSDDLIRAVAIELAKHELLQWLHTPKTRARYLVLATTGHRPAEIKRARPDDVDFARRLWFVRTAKGGVSTILYLNDDMLAAWQFFAQARAWGSFDTRNFVRVLQRCGWPKTIRPYTLRHSTGMALSERGADLGDIQAHLGHASIETTRRFYVPSIAARRMRTSELLEGRLGPTVFLPSPPTKDGARRDAKGRGFSKDPETGVERPARVTPARIGRKA